MKKLFLLFAVVIAYSASSNAFYYVESQNANDMFIPNSQNYLRVGINNLDHMFFTFDVEVAAAMSSSNCPDPRAMAEATAYYANNQIAFNFYVAGGYNNSYSYNNTLSFTSPSVFDPVCDCSKPRPIKAIVLRCGTDKQRIQGDNNYAAVYAHW